jgi:hypothetical protein
MNNKTLFAMYAALFFSILIPASLFLFYGDSTNPNPHLRVVTVKETSNGSEDYPTKVISSSAVGCIKTTMAIAT